MILPGFVLVMRARALGRTVSLTRSIGAVASTLGRHPIRATVRQRRLPTLLLFPPRRRRAVVEAAVAVLVAVGEVVVLVAGAASILARGAVMEARASVEASAATGLPPAVAVVAGTAVWAPAASVMATPILLASHAPALKAAAAGTSTRVVVAPSAVVEAALPPVVVAARHDRRSEGAGERRRGKERSEEAVARRRRVAKLLSHFVRSG
jgi:hypothetical protein